MAAGQQAQARDGREESFHERLDRNLDELTGELRVVVTGVQVLFAFLLVVPFDTGFTRVDRFGRTVYIVTLLLTALSAACTLAPSAGHRLLFRADEKAGLVRFANRITIMGLAFLALAMCGSLLLVTRKLLGTFPGALTAGLAACVFALLWFAIPLWRRETHRCARGTRAPGQGAERPPPRSDGP
jgi:hypothetical protein